MTNWATYPLEVMARGHVLNDEEVRMMCARISALEAELAAARRCPLCGGRTQEIAVKVKPLVWEDDSIPTRERAFASTEIGGYSVVKSHLTGVDYWVTGPGGRKQVDGDFEAAKAAAQADYERRVISAIEAAPVQSAQARPSVAEAAKVLEAHIEADPTAATRALAAIPAKASDLASHWFVCCLRALAGEDGQ